MEISLVIPAFNEQAYIARTIENVLKSGAGKIKEIIVVDNASTDLTGEIARSYPEVTVLVESRKGTGHARQTGFEHATGEVVAFIDADTLIPEHWIEKIRAAFRDPAVVLLSGPYRYLESSRYYAWFLSAVWWVTPPVYWVVGFMANTGSCAVRASALKKIGGFNRSIAFYGDDTDLARRLHKVGKTLWRLSFYTYSSPRRYDQYGLFRTVFFYMINYWWPVLFHVPFTTGYEMLHKDGPEES